MAECEKCGTWKCARCDWTRQRANRHYPPGHHCSRCGSREGTMLPVHHRSPEKCPGYNGEGRL